MVNVQWRRAMFLGFVVCTIALLPSAHADGTETLGPFAGLADGNGIAGNGIGLCELPECNGAGTDRLIQFTVPDGATVNQVLIYWNGFHTEETNGDDTIEVEGIEVLGDLIGGPFLFFLQDGVPNWSTSYRADITGLGLVADGFNSLQITGADFNNVSNGASILAVFDDGSQTEIQLVDGQDLAFCSDGSPEDGCPAFPPPRDTTVTQTFTFANPSDFERQGEIIIFAGSVEGPASEGPPERPNIARVVTGGITTDFADPLASNNEDEWDHIVIPVTIPAGATDLSIQMLSAHSLEGDDRLPASFNWVGSTLSVPEPTCGDGNQDDGETCDPPGSPAGPNGNTCREDCTVCGDGMLDNDEECDDGNADENDACRGNCTIPVCGDGMLDSGEQCDDGNDVDDDACGNDCLNNVCGDGEVNNGEECDDGNDVDDDACANDCTNNVCGDGEVNNGEECDDGNDVDDDACANDCTNNVCGDGEVNNGEECDDGNDVDDDACANDCTNNVCGDGEVNNGEECDDGNDVDDDACGNDCTNNVCGDGEVNNGEECDDGNDVDDDACGNDCTNNVCGDGEVNNGEECDDGNDVDDDACGNDCTNNVCGDGEVNNGEECDDGNDVDDDACGNDCTNNVCGDGEVNNGEECDDGNDVDDDACGNDCTNNVCGDGEVNNGEECDDGNDVDDDACGNDCTSNVCGDGEVNNGEECDDGNDVDDDACGNDCTNNVCGDGEVNNGEECDDGNTDDGDGCDSDCNVEPFCGDGSINQPGETCDPPGKPDGLPNECRDDCTFCGDGSPDSGEMCDDGNNVDGDGCNAFCMIEEFCGDGTVNRPDETCDPPGSPGGASGNTCREDCTVCGDGTTDSSEQCDDGNNSDADQCRNDCTLPVCGDGMRDAGEQCDDGNDDDGDGCRNDCTIPECGDGILDDGEECDDGNRVDGDLCRNDCTLPTCGDGIPDDDEECDDGNDDNFDDCRNDCTIPRCGDGVVDNNRDETCDPPGETAGELGNVCRDDCTVCGDGNTDPDEECDPTNRDDPNRSVCSDECIIEALCELDVMKTCFVPGRDEGDDDDDDDDDCAGKVLAMKLEYTGDGCDVLTNPQGGKAECAGGTGGAEPVSIRVTDNRGDVVYGQDDVVLLGDIVEASAANAGTDKFGSQTDVTIDNGLEEVTFHTSCSQPLQVGDRFGSVRLVELTTTEGGVITLPDENPDPAEGQKECVISPVPAEPHCDGKVKVLTMKYVGGSCDESIQDQGDKFSCVGDAGMTQPVQIICTDYLDTGEPATVNIGDLVDIAAANGGDTTLSSQTDCWVKDEFGNWLQDLSFHTSCSKPINLGDRFGSLEVFSMETTGSGFVGMGQNVVYTYKITNNSDVPAFDVTAFDDQLGEVPGSPIAFIPAHGVVTLQANALISEDTTNIVTVRGQLESGAECPEATDFSIVLVEDPPVGEIECTTKVKATLLTYIGPDIAGPVTVEASARTGGGPAVYEFPGGLTSGTTLSSPAENGFTIDATTRGETDLGSKMTMRINGVDELHHTSCSTPYVSNLPAPLDNPKGQPSTLWFVENFTQKN